MSRTVVPSYRQCLRVYRSRRSKVWRYLPTLHNNRRNPFRQTRAAPQRNIQTTSSKFFRYHFYLPTNNPLESLPKHEFPNPRNQEGPVALVINTPEATATANTRIYSVFLLKPEEINPSITAPIA